MRLKQCIQPAAWLLASCLIAGQAFAEDIDKSRAAEIARSAFGGELFGKIKKTKLADGTPVYEVRLDNNGRMSIVYVDTKGNIRKK